MSFDHEHDPEFGIYHQSWFIESFNIDDTKVRSHTFNFRGNKKAIHYNSEFAH